MGKDRGVARASGEEAFPAYLIGYIGIVLSCLGLVACAGLAIWGLLRGQAGGGMLLYGLLFLPVALLGLVEFITFATLKDWSVAPEVPLGVKLLGNLGRIVGSLAMAACVAFVVLTIACPGSVPPLPVKPTGEAAAAASADAPRPLLAALYVLGIFISMLVRVLGSALSELRTWARPGALVATGLAVALLTVALIFNLTVWNIAEARLALPLFLGGSVVVFLFLLVYLMLPQVADAFESRRL